MFLKSEMKYAFIFTMFFKKIYEQFLIFTVYLIWARVETKWNRQDRKETFSCIHFIFPFCMIVSHVSYYLEKRNKF